MAGEPMANMVSGLRIVCGLLLLCFPAFSGFFFLFYLLGGVSDAVDGAIARRLHQVTEFGSKLDTAADFIFAMAALIKILSVVVVPAWLIIWVVVIALLKVINVVRGYMMFQEFVAVHSLTNKICGVMVFCIPLYITCVPEQIAALLVLVTCLVATFAAIQEGRYITSGKMIA